MGDINDKGIAETKSVEDEGEDEDKDCKSSREKSCYVDVGLPSR